MSIKQLCMALQARTVSRAFEKQGPRPPKDKLFAEASIEDYCEICNHGQI